VSGVCGIVRWDGGAVAAADLDRQMSALRHLGPDRSRQWMAGDAGMGALLMRTSREDAFDSQPLRDSAADLTFVCDARLDNREHVARALGIDDAQLAGMADSALLFAAYRAWGAGCAERLIGDFVFAAWDGRAGVLTLGRDHMGQRHLFYHVGEGFCAFASERKGLWGLPDVPRRLPTDLIARLLVEAGLVPGRRDDRPAAADGLQRVAGGTTTTISQGVVREHRYWTPQAGPEHLNRDEAYYVDAYRRVLGEAVACRLRRATAPVGLFLGGGFDSGAIAALAGPALAPTGNKLIAAASVAADPRNPRDARRWVETCERHMPHLDVRYVTDDRSNVLAGLERSFFVSDSPHAANRFVADSLLTAIKGTGARMVMDGHGGDYTLNPRADGFLGERLRRGQFGRFFSTLRARRQAQHYSLPGLFKSEILPLLPPVLTRRWIRWRGGLAPFGPTMPIGKDFARHAADLGARLPRPGWTAARDGRLRVLQARQGAPAGGWSMAANTHGLEFTQPFHDKRVVELALAIPDDFRLRNGRERSLAREALKDLYPPEFQTRRDHNDAMDPDYMDMAARLRPEILAEIDRMEQSGKLSSYLDFPKLRRMLTRTVGGRPGRYYEPATRQAIRAFLLGRYIEWFSGGNS